MQQKKNTKVGKINFLRIFSISLLLIIITFSVYSETTYEGSHTNIKVLDKISSKNTLVKLKNGEEKDRKSVV